MLCQSLAVALEAGDEVRVLGDTARWPSAGASRLLPALAAAGRSGIATLSGLGHDSAARVKLCRQGEYEAWGIHVHLDAFEAMRELGAG